MIPRGRLGLALAAVALLVASATPAGAYESSVACTLGDERITESSGAVVGRDRPDVLFTHNDSGDDAQFFAVGLGAGSVCPTLAVYRFPGVDANDWEDMAAGPDEQGRWSLWFGDIGDNAMMRTSMTVFRTPEPVVAAAPAAAAIDVPEMAAFELVYEDVAHDAETLLVHPVTGQLYVVTKTYTGQASVYAAPQPLVAGQPNTLRRVADLVFTPTGTDGGSAIPGIVPPQLATTGGDITRDGRRLAIRTYTDAYEWVLPGDTVDDLARSLNETVRPTRTALPSTVQGEALAYRPDGRSFFVTTEGVGAPVHLLAGAPTPAVPESSSVPVIAVAAALAALAVVGIGRRRAATR